MCCPQCTRPTLAQILEIGLARLDPVSDFGGARVPAHHQNIERQADAEIGAHPGGHGDQAYLEPIVDIDLATYCAARNSLYVFMLPHINATRLARCFHE